MHIISLKMLRDFWLRHPQSERPLRNWHSIVEHAHFADFAEIKKSFRSADYAAPYTVFDLGGNKYRVVVVVHFTSGKVYVRWVMTHREYDNWCALYRKGKLQ